MRTVVVGGAGFIGHHLVTALRSDGDDVLVIDDLSTGSASRLPPEVTLEQLDVSTDDLTTVFRRWNAEVIYHLAAQASVPASMADPLFDLRVNGIGTLRLLQSAREVGSAKVVFVSSGGAVYGETRHAATERTGVRPLSYYGAHKLLGEYYVSLSGLPYAIARPSNVYGPGQDASGEGAVIAAFAARTLGRDEIVIHGDGQQERDFVNVHDVVAAFRMLARAGANSTWNVAFGESVSVRQLADTFERVAGYKVGRRFGPARAGDVRVSRVANEKLKLLGWSPRVSLESGLRELLESTPPA